MPIYTFNNNYNTHFAHTNSKASCLILYRNSLWAQFRCFLPKVSSDAETEGMATRPPDRDRLQVRTLSSQTTNYNMQSVIPKHWTSRPTRRQQQHQEYKSWKQNVSEELPVCHCHVRMSGLIGSAHICKQRQQRTKKKKKESIWIVPCCHSETPSDCTNYNQAHKSH